VISILIRVLLVRKYLAKCGHRPGFRAFWRKEAGARSAAQGLPRLCLCGLSLPQAGKNMLSRRCHAAGSTGSALPVWTHGPTVAQPQLAAASARDKAAHVNIGHLCSLPHPANLTLAYKCCQQLALNLKQKVLLSQAQLSKVFG